MFDALERRDGDRGWQLGETHRVRGTRVVVRPTDERPHVEDHPAELDQSIESIGLDPFEDPLGVTAGGATRRVYFPRSAA